MVEEQVNTEHSLWFSTYGLLTSKRLLEQFHIELAQDKLFMAVKNPYSLYHRLLSVPLKHVLNGIILQQVHDYQVYIQKMFIDYLLSLEASSKESSPGAGTREELENERIRLLELNEALANEETAHKKRISDSQAQLIQLSKVLKQWIRSTATALKKTLKKHDIIKEVSLIEEAITLAMIEGAETNTDTFSLFLTSIAKKLNFQLIPALNPPLLEIISTLEAFQHDLDAFLSLHTERAEDALVIIRGYRSQFYDFIIRIGELLTLLPNYKPDKSHEEENRASLHFDMHLGE